MKGKDDAGIHTRRDDRHRCTSSRGGFQARRALEAAIALWPEATPSQVLGFAREIAFEQEAATRNQSVDGLHPGNAGQEAEVNLLSNYPRGVKPRRVYSP